MIIKDIKEAEEKQKQGGVLLEIRGTGDNRVYVFKDEDDNKLTESKIKKVKEK